jgi:SNF2 family DNA or RNA helicase
MSIFYERKQITTWLGSHTVAKARGYEKAVSALRWAEHDTLAGKVQGTQRRPYEVAIYFNDLEGNMWIEGECSCPVGFDCKHVATILIAGLNLVQARPAPGIRPELIIWLEDFRNKLQVKSGKSKKSNAPKTTHALVYLIKPSLRGGAEVHLYKSRVNAEGVIKTLDDPWQGIDKALVNPPKFVTEEDLPILRGLLLDLSRGYGNGFGLHGATGAVILEKLIATGRTFALPNASTMHNGAPCVVHLGASRLGQLAWQTQVDKTLVPSLQTQPPATILLTSTQPCWYVDTQNGEVGKIEIPCSSDHLSTYLSIPAISLEESGLVSKVLIELAPDLPLPPGHNKSTVRIINATPNAVLDLSTLPTFGPPSMAKQNALDFAKASFDYAGVRVFAHSGATLIRLPNDEVVQIERQHQVEKHRLTELHQAGLQKIPSQRANGPSPFPEEILGFQKSEDWLKFIRDAVPKLRESGWQVEMTEDFRFNMIEVTSIDGSLRQTEDGWFDVEMGITVNERKLRLEPLLAELFRRDGRWLSGALDTIEDDELIDLKTEQNERLYLRADRLKPIVRSLVDLFDTIGEGSTRISVWDAARLDALAQTGRWQFYGDESIRQLAQRLLSAPEIGNVPIPKGLKAALRGYQHQGLNWMQFLRKHGLSGILADDMGLGKTVQTLAHILAEKEAKRLTRPALIVVPTTLIHNWCDEAQRFAPTLQVLDLQGAQRHARFEQIPKHDLILTTYPLLWRDEAMLAEYDYHLLILDEAQNVKNAATKAATTIRNLRAQHRLCLTGTPLENHLGELWAQFDFLLPGFLGTHKDFTKRWRAPIEKGNDTVRRELLARRIRPFMLRRRKDEVATELPPKTIIVQSVELEGAQRDLYETVRAAMQEKVRAAIAAKGLARSHIIVLEALLKLRQVCCDPRLVKLNKTATIKTSAKLTLLLEMLPALIDEGRRILVFSQFTSMLDLIATALDRAMIGYVMLTGQTIDRQAPIKSFTQGTVPLFLISLKAGGVGLNLTAADTVIHYDPWWNPAVENQATDRAHRLGQVKPVFVYKLIAAGSVEEKIVAMQEKKAGLANAILSEDSANAEKFSADDLQALFEPIPTVTSAEPPKKSRARKRSAT